MFRSLILAFAAAPTFSLADLPEKFVLEGETLVYDTQRAASEDNREIENADVEALLAVLEEYDGITTLRLNSGGGQIWGGNEMARIVIDFELDTEVVGECSSSCVNIFLAGQARDLARGSKIGFHQSSWSAQSIQSYYEKWRDEEDWESPFDFASWIYKDTQSEVFKEMTYMISRGVDPEFAIQTKRLRASMWFPSRRVLTEAGVLRD